MARPNTRQTFIDYCLRNLGHPVIQINVDDDQIEDRVDEALQFFAQYHFDGIEKAYLRYAITALDIQRGYIDLTYDSTNTNRFVEASGTAGLTADRQFYTEAGQTGGTPNFVQIEQLIDSVTKVFHFSQSSINMFDVRYQYMLNDLYAFGSIDMTQYVITQSYLTLLQQILSPEKAVRFSRKTNKLYIDMKWSREVKPGDLLIIECYRVIDAKVFPEVYDDMLLKKYATALIKRQWGANLSKFNGIQMPGGVTFNGTDIFLQANEEIRQIEDTVMSKWSEFPEFFTG